jgi:hypothetical protein
MSLSSRAWDGIIIYFFGIELELEGLGSGGDGIIIYFFGIKLELEGLG